jgi:threonine/homoserine/homoserine lactone efflux protein
MTSSLITISITGLLAGFIFSMPIAGPISILITTNALRGRLRYCNRVNLGASIATFTYVFIAVFGLSKFYLSYKPAIPYLFLLGCMFLLFLGYRIFTCKFDFEHLEDKSYFNEKIKNKEIGGFYTGCIINFLNPTLFLGWLTSTFLVISFVTSLGLNTGGLNKFVNQSVKEIGRIDSSTIEITGIFPVNNSDLINTQEVENYSEGQADSQENFHLLISVLYAFFISAGSIIWFYMLALITKRFRQYINLKYLSAFIRSMGIVLSIFGLYFGYLGSKMIHNLK